jgi:hypothetical protein
MATKKSTVKTPVKKTLSTKANKAPAKTAAKASKAPASRTRAAKPAPGEPRPLSTEELTLLGSYPASFDKLPDQSVPRILTMAREVLAAGRQAIDALEANTRIGRHDLEKLAAETELLSRSEELWAKSRDVRVDPKAVAEGESLKADALAALDYWLAGNGPVEERVARVREGTGVADLSDDLDKLADLLDENSGHLKKADLVKSASSRMRELATSLMDSLAGKKSDVHGRTLLALRNRAFYGLVARMDSVCAGGRYAFRKEPRKAKLFASVATRKRVQAKGRTAKGPKGPDESDKKPT